MAAVCREWYRPAGYFSPLCTMQFNPVEGNSQCPICPSPEAAQSTDTCGVFDFMQVDAEDIVNIPAIMDLEYLPGALTAASNRTCNKTIYTGEFSQSLMPELDNVRTTFIRTGPVDPNINVWSTPIVEVGERHVRHRWTELSTGLPKRPELNWSYTLGFQMSMVVNYNTCLISFVYDLWKTNVSIVGSYPTGPPGSYCGFPLTLTGDQITSTHQQIGNGYNTGKMSGNVWKTTPASTPFFTEFSSDVNRHSPWVWRVASIGCANNILWWNSVETHAVSDGTGGLGNPNCISLTVDVFPIGSSGLDSPAISLWTPGVIHFKTWGL